jgi:hypothetical protein
MEEPGSLSYGNLKNLQTDIWLYLNFLYVNNFQAKIILFL